jgi:hypothetical protein
MVKNFVYDKQHPTMHVTIRGNFLMGPNDYLTSAGKTNARAGRRCSCALLLPVLTAALELVTALAAPTDARAQSNISVSLAYDHLIRETGDALGYQQVIYSVDDPGGLNTPAMREWSAAKDRVPSGMSSLVARCVPPVMQARALLLEGGAILMDRNRRRSSDDVKIVNAKTAQATALLKSVSDCWQLMVRYEQNPDRQVPQPYRLGITENVQEDASNFVARVLYDARTGGTPRTDPVLRAGLQKLQAGDSRLPANECLGKMQQAADDLQQGNVTSARENALQGQACYDRMPSKPGQPSSEPLVGQVTEITPGEANVLRGNGQVIDWTPFFDALGRKQQEAIEDGYWSDCVPVFKPVAEATVQVKGTYGVRRGSASVIKPDVYTKPLNCKPTADTIVRGVSVPLSLWPPQSQMAAVEGISLEYTLTFLRTSIKMNTLDTVKADHGYFETGGKLYHYSN